MKVRVLILGGLLAALAPLGQSYAQGVPGEGRAIADRWCAPCHLVSSEQTNANADVPSFVQIANKSPDDFAWIAPFLADPHPPMPNFSLTRDEISNLVAYIASLR